jgi:phosphate starvation-inducible protein PhoH and related proteins
LTSTDVKPGNPVQVQFDDNALLTALFGHHDEHLLQIERLLDVTLRYRGNQLEIQGPETSREIAKVSIASLYKQLKSGQDVGPGEVQAAVRMAASDDSAGAGISIRTRKRTITPRSPVQAKYLEALGHADLTFGLGPAGTGKTYLAVAMAVSDLIQGKVDRLILSRPAVEAGERLGFLPGDLQDKIDPYLRPLYDALYDMLPGEQVASRLESGEIEVAPLAFMRGRTLSRAFIILDEAQNTSAMQMKMFLTRLGEGSRMAITGDMTQIDLPPGTRSGLGDALDVLDNVNGVEVVRFGEDDVVRHTMVARIVTAYNKRDKQRSAVSGEDMRGSARDAD